MRISDWSSDVCSSDLLLDRPDRDARQIQRHQNEREPVMTARFGIGAKHAEQPIGPDRARRPGFLAIDDIVIAVTHGLAADRSEEHTSELQSLMRISYAVFCFNKKQIKTTT